MIAPDIGGGFGPKVFVYPEEILVPFLALQLGRPVKWIEDRREHFISTAHGRDQVHEVELAFDETGRVLALRDRFLLDNGAYNPMGLTDAYNTARLISRGPYKIPNLSVTGTCVSTNKVPNAPYRGAGRPGSRVRHGALHGSDCSEVELGSCRGAPPQSRSAAGDAVSMPEFYIATVNRFATTAETIPRLWPGRCKQQATKSCVNNKKSCASKDDTLVSASAVTWRGPAWVPSRARRCALMLPARS